MGLYLGAVKSFVELRSKRGEPDPSYDKALLGFRRHYARFDSRTYIRNAKTRKLVFWSVVPGQDGNEIFASILHLISNDEDDGYNGKFETYWKRGFETGDHGKAFSVLNNKFSSVLFKPLKARHESWRDDHADA